jgi:CBS domain-containing protein
MNAPEYYATAVASVLGNTPVRVLADRMHEGAIGCIVIRDTERRPIGIVTDRDLATRVIAEGRDPEAVTAIEIATRPVQVATSDEPIEVVVARMREHRIRRLPVVRDGVLVGIVTIDDLVVQLARELSSLGTSAQVEIDAARREARSRRRRVEFEQTLASIEASLTGLGKEAADFLSREVESLRDRLRRNQS